MQQLSSAKLHRFCVAALVAAMVAAMSAGAVAAQLTFASAGSWRLPRCTRSSAGCATADLGERLQGEEAQPTGVAATLVQGAALCAAAAIASRAARTHQRIAGAGRSGSPVHLCALSHGEDLSVPDDAFVVLGMAHCFEQVDGKLQDTWVLEPISASTVEVIENGAATSYETFIGTTVRDVLAKDSGAFPPELLAGHEVQWGENLEFRTGCAARTWMRDHARDVVRKMAPDGQVRTGFNTSTENKRILNFVNEVKDSDNIKQDMSIDVYGRSEEDAEGEKEGVEAQIADLYNV